MTTSAARIASNYRSLVDRIATAAVRSGRDPDAVTLVAVTKYVGQPEIEALLAAGCRELGESRPQALWEKGETIDVNRVNWHLIGHLQRNKVKRTLPFVTLFHSGDSLRLLRELALHAETLGRKARVLLEVNISGDPSKHGFTAAELPDLMPQVASLSPLVVEGLMAMAAREGGLDAARRDFAALRELRDRLRPDCPAGIRLDELSMGMSGDFEVAIEEGATMVRVGSALYE